uniref:Uncharacterized protein n=1 Tax=Mycena chlorophos TaxID=658473 RepID=A0ABQ0LZU7_MYCCL|nr:predicted protein [Mycena chlorophos]
MSLTLTQLHLRRWWPKLRLFLRSVVQIHDPKPTGLRQRHYSSQISFTATAKTGLSADLLFVAVQILPRDPLLLRPRVFATHRIDEETVPGGTQITLEGAPPPRSIGQPCDRTTERSEDYRASGKRAEQYQQTIGIFSSLLHPFGFCAAPRRKNVAQACVGALISDDASIADPMRIASRRSRMPRLPLCPIWVACCSTPSIFRLRRLDLPLPFANPTTPAETKINRLDAAVNDRTKLFKLNLVNDLVFSRADDPTQTVTVSPGDKRKVWIRRVDLRSDRRSDLVPAPEEYHIMVNFEQEEMETVLGPSCSNKLGRADLQVLQNAQVKVNRKYTLGRAWRYTYKDIATSQERTQQLAAGTEVFLTKGPYSAQGTLFTSDAAVMARGANFYECRPYLTRIKRITYKSESALKYTNLV